MDNKMSRDIGASPPSAQDDPGRSAPPDTVSALSDVALLRDRAGSLLWLLSITLMQGQVRALCSHGSQAQQGLVRARRAEVRQSSPGLLQ
jgi:hypothetical protein